VQAIRLARTVVSDERATPDARAVMLAWLFHDVGDIHQPLHSSALFSARLFREGDRGGNSIRSSQSGNLHALWDQFPGRGDTYRGARNKAIADLANPELVALGTKAEAVLDEKAWLDESHDLALAKTAAYAPDVLDALRMTEAAGGDVEEIGLSEAYLKAGGHESARRLVQAGYRLGAVLKQLAK
jgi:S1/P1 nuclease